MIRVFVHNGSPLRLSSRRLLHSITGRSAAPEISFGYAGAPARRGFCPGILSLPIPPPLGGRDPPSRYRVRRQSPATAARDPVPGRANIAGRPVYGSLGLWHDRLPTGSLSAASIGFLWRAYRDGARPRILPTRRRSGITIERSSSVLGSRPIKAMAFGAHTEQGFAWFRSPAHRSTNAFARYSPAFRMPRSSAWPAFESMVSASS